jgi:hypothetical protein
VAFVELVIDCATTGARTKQEIMEYLGTMFAEQDTEIKQQNALPV